MRKGWEIKKLGEVCEILNGGTPDTSIPKFWDGENLWITPKDMGKLKSIFVDDTLRKITDEGLKNSSAKILPPNSIILSSRAPIGHLAINIKPMSTNQGCKGLVPNKKIDYLFLYYFLYKSVDLLNSLGTGTTFKELSGSKLASVEIPLPQLSEQQEIVSILDDAFESIERAKSNAVQNLKNARELFESLLNELFIVKKGEWEEFSVEELVQKGYITKPQDGNHGEIHPLKNDYVESGIPFVMSRDMIDGTIDDVNCKFITEKQAKGLRTGFALNQDVLLSHKGTIGSVGLLNTNYRYVVLTPQITYYRIKDNSKLISKFIYYYFLTPIFQKILNDIAQGGSTRAYIGITRQLNLPIKITNINNQRLIVEKLDAIVFETKRLESLYQQKLNDLEELKKSILQKAFNGELKTSKLTA